MMKKKRKMEGQRKIRVMVANNRLQMRKKTVEPKMMEISLEMHRQTNKRRNKSKNDHINIKQKITHTQIDKQFTLKPYFQKLIKYK